MNAVAYQSFQMSTTMPQPKWRAVDWSQGFNPGWRGDAMDHFVGKVGEQKLADLMGSKPRPVANVTPKPVAAAVSQPKSGRAKFRGGELAEAILKEVAVWRSTRELADRFQVPLSTMSEALNRLSGHGRVYSRMEARGGRRTRMWCVDPNAEVPLSDTEQAVLDAYRAGHTSAAAIAREVGVYRRTVVEAGHRLADRGLLEVRKVYGRTMFVAPEEAST